MTAPRVLLCRLFERTSAKGTRYSSGRLGSAKLLAFEATDVPEDQGYGADVLWNVFTQGYQDSAQHREAPTRGREQIDELASRFRPDTKVDL
jgi:hypothetical protein